MRSGAPRFSRERAPLHRRRRDSATEARAQAALAVVVLTPVELELVVERAIRRALQLAQERDALSTAQAAQLAGRSTKTIRRWIASGELRADRRGRNLLVLRADLFAFLAGKPEGITSDSILTSLKK